HLIGATPAEICRDGGQAGGVAATIPPTSRTSHRRLCVRPATHARGQSCTVPRDSSGENLKLRGGFVVHRPAFPPSNGRRDARFAGGRETRSLKGEIMTKLLRRSLGGVPLAIAALAFSPVAASAGASKGSTEGAHFFPDTSASVNDSGALVVHIDEAGLGTS